VRAKYDAFHGQTHGFVGLIWVLSLCIGLRCAGAVDAKLVDVALVDRNPNVTPPTARRFDIYAVRCRRQVCPTAGGRFQLAPPPRMRNDGTAMVR
jgi:hypothetical protein